MQPTAQAVGRNDKKMQPLRGERAWAQASEGVYKLSADCYFRKRPITYITNDSTTLITIDVASGK